MELHSTTTEDAPPQDAGGGTWALAALLLAFLAWLLACQISADRAGVADDAYITYLYGRNLVEVQDLRFNASDPGPVAGYSSLTHVLLASAFTLAGWDPLVATRLLGVLLLVSIPIAFAWAAARVLRAPPARALVAGAGAGLLLAGLAETGPHLVSGMETVIFTAVHAWVVAWAVCVAATRPRLGALGSVGSVALLGLLVLTRPEGLLLAGGYLLAVVAARALGAGEREGEGWSGALRACAGVLVGLALFAGAYAAWKLVAHGQLLSNPYYVKSQNAIFGSSGAALPGWHVVERFGVTRWLPLFGIVALGALALGAGRGAWRLAAILVAPSLAVVLLYARAIHEMAGEFRYEYPMLVPLLAALVFLALELGRRSTRAFTAVVLGLGLCAPILLSTSDARLASWLANPRSAATAWTTWENDQNALARLGHDLGDTGLEQQATILLSGAGQVPWFSRFRAVDWIGLNDKTLSGRVALSIDEVWDYIEAQEPDVVFSILPPAQPGSTAREEDAAFLSENVQATLGGRGSALFRHWDPERLAEMFWREMCYVRDGFTFGAAYRLGDAWRSEWWVLAYVRRDSPHRERILEVLAASPRPDRGRDLAEVYGVDPRALGP